jgi:hypothetical protein
MTAEGGNWTGWVVNEIVGRRLRSRTRATSTTGTGSTITIIIVGPMIGRAAAAVLAAADRGDDRDHDCLSFSDMCQSVRGGPLALQLPFLKISESMGNHDSKIVGAGSVD